MKMLIFVSLIIYSFSVFSLTEILEGTTHGYTFIDPMNEMARINYTSDIQNANLYMKPTYNCSKYFMVKRQTPSGDVVIEKTLNNAESCEKIRQASNNVLACQEHKATVMTIQDPTNCGSNPCQKLSTPMKGQLDISLKRSDFKEFMKNCSPENELLIIKDKTSPRGAFSSMKDKSHCGLERKKIFAGDRLWSQKGPENMQIHTSDRAGFYIGDHTHYFFDYNKKQWCIHFKPELNSTIPTCSEKYNNITRSIAFIYPSQDKKVTRGVVKLGIENGKPVAHIGHPQSELFTPNPLLDENRPMLKVSLLNENSSLGGVAPGRRSIFELKDSMSGSVVKTLTVAPTFSIGQKLNTPGACNPASCLNVPEEVSGAQNNSSRFCKNNFEPLNLTDGAEDTCYSCNGVTAGACGSQTTLITKQGKATKEMDLRKFISYEKAANDLLSCKGTPQLSPASGNTAQ